MKIEILSRYSKAVILAGEYESLQAALKNRADLSGADLSRANLHGANLSRANLSGANLHGANLYGADLSEADLHEADLHGANLQWANLSGADLSEADLHEANLQWANLSGADLHEADLHGANLQWANLSGADLHEANLQWANLSGADLYRAKGTNPFQSTPLLMLLDQPEGARLRAYKLVNRKNEGHVKGRIVYEINKYITVSEANTDVDQECGAGINVATLDWCMREWQAGYKILLVEFLREDIACIPTATDGKFRLHACTPIREIDLARIGLVSVEKAEDATA